MKKLLLTLGLTFLSGVCMFAQTTVLKPETLFGDSQKLGLEYVLRVNPDRLLSTAYTAMGQKPKASPYGGWESPTYGAWQDRTLRGHSLGHYLSALAGFYNSTGSLEAKEKLDYTVSEIKKLQRKDGYFDCIPSTPFDQVFTSNGNFNAGRFDLNGWWVPWYAIHKIYAGLIDAYTLGKNQDALEIVTKMADWAVKGTSNMTDDQFQKMLNCEHGGMCKVFADMYELTGKEAYLKMAERFIHQEIYRPLVKEQDRLQGYHANTQMPKIIGLAKLYELTGKSEYRKAVEFFFKTVTETRSYVIGGNSIGEHFGPQYQETLGRDTCETCNTYNMLEIAQHVFKWNKNNISADYYETALYNHILASQDPETGAKTYFVSQLPGFFKIYGTEENAWWCCTGTGMENPERYNRFIAEDIDQTLYINLFIPSTITTDDGWKLELSTNFPYEQKANIKVLQAGSKSHKIKIRIPSWVQEKAKDSDGYTVAQDLTASYSQTVDLPMKLHIRRAGDHSGNFSILYGPIVLAAQLGNDKLPPDIVDNQLIYMNYRATKVSAITADVLNLDSWIKETDSTTLTFVTDSSAAKTGESYELKPFYATHHVRYTTYFNSEDPKLDARTAKYSEITIDNVEPGRQQSEVEHKFKSENADAGYYTDVDRSYRSLEGENSFVSYRMKFDGTSSNKIIVTVYGKDYGSLKVNFDDKELETITFDGSKGAELVDFEIEVPKSLVKEKGKGKKSFYGVIKLSGDLKVLELLTVR